MNRGTITVFAGPVQSGKTTAMSRMRKLYMLNSRHTAITIKFMFDTRFEKVDCSTSTSSSSSPPSPKNSRPAIIESNDGMVKVDGYAFKTLCDAYDAVKEYDVICIDEGQFFDDIVEYSERLANEGHIVIISILSGTFERKQWPHVGKLLAIADSVTFLTAICMKCPKHEMTSAPFSLRLDGRDTKLVSIGGNDKYLPVCRRCYIAGIKERAGGVSCDTTITATTVTTTTVLSTEHKQTK